MIYIIISNIGLAAMTIVVYTRYSKFRISSSNEIKNLRKKCDLLVDDLQKSNEKLLLETKNDNEKIEALLREIDELRKEKEKEIKLRFDAEKQVSSALHKISEFENRIKDWSVMQEAAMKDSKEAIFKIGNDLYKKLNDSYQVEIETNKNLIGKVSRNISDFFEKISKSPLGNLKSKESTNKQESNLDVEQIDLEEKSKYFIDDLISTMKASSYVANRDYFLSSNFNDNRAKLMLCEFAFTKNKKLYILDFKACKYLSDYENLKHKNPEEAKNNLINKLNRYFSYLNNPKYRDSILKALSVTKVQFDKISINIVVPSRLEIHILKEIDYYNKAKDMQLDVVDFDGVSNIVL